MERIPARAWLAVQLTNARLRSRALSAGATAAVVVVIAKHNILCQGCKPMPASGSRQEIRASDVGSESSLSTWTYGNSLVYFRSHSKALAIGPQIRTAQDLVSPGCPNGPHRISTHFPCSSPQPIHNAQRPPRDAALQPLRRVRIFRALRELCAARTLRGWTCGHRHPQLASRRADTGPPGNAPGNSEMRMQIESRFARLAPAVHQDKLS